MDAGGNLRLLQRLAVFLALVDLDRLIKVLDAADVAALEPCNRIGALLGELVSPRPPRDRSTLRSY
jgi:hypothetical protein